MNEKRGLKSVGCVDESAALRRVINLIGLEGGSCDEGRVATCIRDALSKRGLPKSAVSTDSAHKRSPAGGATGNLIIKLKGTVRAPRRLLMAHMDTVPLAVGCEPVKDGDIIRPASRLTALGGDDRAGCAVVLTALSEILERGLPHPPITALFTVQEEIGLRGARFLAAGQLGNPQLCFNWDGRDPATLIVGAVGATNMSINVSGVASHAGAHPEDGVNAAVVASLALADLQCGGWHGLVTQGRNRGASNVGTISGGGATNVVMPEVRLEAEARSHSAAFRRRIVKEYRRAFSEAVQSVANVAGDTAHLNIEEDTRYEAFSISKQSACVREAEAAVKVQGLTPDIRGCDGGLDANWMAAHGFPTVTLGCGQYNIHTVDETLSIPQYLQACQIAVHLATGGDFA